MRLGAARGKIKLDFVRVSAQRRATGNDIANLIAHLAVLATKASGFLRLVTTGLILDVRPVIRACTTCS